MKTIKIFAITLLMGIVMAATSCKKEAEAFISADKTEVAVNETVKFTNTSNNAGTYEWDFGDGKTSTEQSPSHSWSSAGTYLVKMTACPNTSHGPQQHFGGNKCDEASISIKVN
jgi:PKD repeat protein